MRPFRSFLLLFLLLACLTGMCYFFPASSLVPTLPDLFPEISTLILKQKTLRDQKTLPEQVRDIAKAADGIIVGSAIVKEIEKNSKKKYFIRRVGDYVQKLAEASHQ